MPVSADDADADGTPPDIALTTDGESPEARLQQVFSEVREEIDGLNAGRSVPKMLDAVEEMAEIELDAENSSAVHKIAQAYVKDLADAKKGVNRSMLEGHWQDTLDELEREKKVEDGDAVIFTEFLRSELYGVTKKVTTDLSSTEETEYVLRFRDGTGITVTQSTLFDERSLWKAYTAVKEGDYPERAPVGEEYEWDNFVADLIEEREEVEREVGARTAALQALENYVQSSTAYGNVVDAVEQGGVYVDAEPPGHSEVQVPREAIASITSTHEITDRALQAEISARDLSGPSLAGSKVSDSTSVNGRWQTFWYLDGAEFDDTGPYEEEATDPIDRMDDVAADDEDDGVEWDDWMLAYAADQQEDSDGDDNADPVNSDEDDDGESVTGDDEDTSNAGGYGRMGSFGAADPDDDDEDGNGGEE